MEGQERTTMSRLSRIIFSQKASIGKNGMWKDFTMKDGYDTVTYLSFNYHCGNKELIISINRNIKDIQEVFEKDLNSIFPQEIRILKIRSLHPSVIDFDKLSERFFKMFCSLEELHVENGRVKFKHKAMSADPSIDRFCVPKLTLCCYNKFKSYIRLFNPIDLTIILVINGPNNPPISCIPKTVKSLNIEWIYYPVSVEFTDLDNIESLSLKLPAPTYNWKFPSLPNLSHLSIESESKEINVSFEDECFKGLTSLNMDGPYNWDSTKEILKRCPNMISYRGPIHKQTEQYVQECERISTRDPNDNIRFRAGVLNIFRNPSAYPKLRYLDFCFYDLSIVGGGVYSKYDDDMAELFYAFMDAHPDIYYRGNFPKGIIERLPNLALILDSRIYSDEMKKHYSRVIAKRKTLLGMTTDESELFWESKYDYISHVFTFDLLKSTSINKYVRVLQRL